MERQARFVLMGSLVLAFAMAIFGSVYWLHGIGTFGATAVYTIRFQGVAPAVGIGASVLFNGVRVGEVANIKFNPADPGEVLATIVIDQKTPVRVDTQVGVDTQGLIGGGVISLRGGAAASPAPSGVGGAPPVLAADPALVMGLSETARQVLQRIDKILADNADSLHATLSNLQVFSDALGRNSGHVDAIMQGLERMTGGGPAKAPMPTYDLAAPTSFPSLKKARIFSLVRSLEGWSSPGRAGLFGATRRSRILSSAISLAFSITCSCSSLFTMFTASSVRSLIIDSTSRPT